MCITLKPSRLHFVQVIDRMIVNFGVHAEGECKTTNGQLGIDQTVGKNTKYTVSTAINCPYPWMSFFSTQQCTFKFLPIYFMCEEFQCCVLCTNDAVLSNFHPPITDEYFSVSIYLFILFE